MRTEVEATEKRPRTLRVGDSDVQIWECWYWPREKGEIGRHWFEAPNGTKTATYRDMCKKLGGRPKPRLPEDEHLPAPVVDGAGATATDVGHSTLENPTPSTDPEWEPCDKKKPYRLMILPGLRLKNMSDEEYRMQTIWYAEWMKEEEPDLYEAALDSVKRKEYLDRRKAEERERLAADSAPRCQYVRSDGETCGSPALKNRRFCYFHIRTTDDRKKSTEVDLPVLEDDPAIQMAVTNVCRGLLKGRLEPKCASTLLYGLQVASTSLRRLEYVEEGDEEDDEEKE